MSNTRFSLRRMRERLQLTQGELGEAVGESAQVISNIERRVTDLRVELLEQLARQQELSLDALIRLGLPESETPPAGNPQILLPEQAHDQPQRPNLYYVPQSVQAGLDLTNLEQALQESALVPGYVPELPPQQRHFAFQVSGSSMEPVLYPGDYLIAQPIALEHVQRRELCVAALLDERYGPTIVVKYLSRSRNSPDIRLSSANPDYPEEFVYPYQLQAVFRYTALLTLHVESWTREWRRLQEDNQLLRQTHLNSERERRHLLDYVEHLKSLAERRDSPQPQ